MTDHLQEELRRASIMDNYEIGDKASGFPPVAAW